MLSVSSWIFQISLETIVCWIWTVFISETEHLCNSGSYDQHLTVRVSTSDFSLLSQVAVKSVGLCVRDREQEILDRLTNWHGEGWSLLLKDTRLTTVNSIENYNFGLWKAELYCRLGRFRRQCADILDIVAVTCSDRTWCTDRKRLKLSIQAEWSSLYSASVLYKLKVTAVIVIIIGLVRLTDRYLPNLKLAGFGIRSGPVDLDRP